MTERETTIDSMCVKRNYSQSKAYRLPFANHTTRPRERRDTGSVIHKRHCFTSRPMYRLADVVLSILVCMYIGYTDSRVRRVGRRPRVLQAPTSDELPNLSEPPTFRSLSCVMSGLSGRRPQGKEESDSRCNQALHREARAPYLPILSYLVYQPGDLKSSEVSFVLLITWAEILFCCKNICDCVNLAPSGHLRLPRRSPHPPRSAILPTTVDPTVEGRRATRPLKA